MHKPTIAMKKHRCSRCKKTKTEKHFHKSNTHSTGVQRYCKSCKRKIDSRGHGRYNGKYCVYYLPKDRYIGMTKHYTKRIQKHQSRGKNVKGAFVLFTTKNAKLAHAAENFLHIIGFKGFRY